MILYHYCSNQTFLSILEHKQVWASELSLSNDHLEGRWIKEVFSRCCSDRGVDAINLVQLLEHLENLLSFVGATGFCMSEDGDILSQWRGYADDGAGVSVGFSQEYLSLLCAKQREEGVFSVALQQVSYELSDQMDAISPLLHRILEQVEAGAFRKKYGGLLIGPTEEERERYEQAFKKLINLLFFAVPHFYKMKNPAFREEREWRLLSVINRGASGLDVGDLAKLDFRGGKDRIVPFRRIEHLEVGIRPVDRIVLGPRNITPERVVRAVLEKHGLEGVEVVRSAASYR